jgi:hypothetical protein
MATSKTVPLKCEDRRSSSQRGSSLVLGLPSRLPEIAIGFSDGGLIASTHLRDTRHKTRRFTWPPPPSFPERRSAAGCGRGASGRSCTRGNNADGADDLVSHAVLSIAEHMREAGAPFRAGRVGGLPRPVAFTIAIGRATNAALRPRAAELFFDLIAAMGAVGLCSPCFHLPCL